MRVLYLIDSLVPGGAERSLAAMAPHLVAGGIVLEVATLHESELGAAARIARSLGAREHRIMHVDLGHPTPRATLGSNHSICIAVIIPSRPNVVEYQGMPAYGYGPCGVRVISM